jgi:hypothetical protein
VKNLQARKLGQCVDRDRVDAPERESTIMSLAHFNSYDANDE